MRAALPIPFPSIPGIPGPGDLAKAALDAIGKAITSAIAGAIDRIGRELLGLLKSQTGIDLAGGWWTTGRAQQIQMVVLRYALILLVFFVLVAVIYHAVRGEPGRIVHVLVVDVPAAVLGVVVIYTVIQGLSSFCDQLTLALLANVPANVGHYMFTGGGGITNIVLGGLLAVVLGAMFLAATVVLWLEVLFLTIATYLCLGLLPLALAARVWAPARPVFNRLLEIILALLFAKPVIALALGFGSAMVAGGVGSSLGALGTMGMGVGLVAAACFAPYAMLKVIPLVEVGAGAGFGMRAGMRQRAGGVLATGSTVTSLATSGATSSAVLAAPKPSAPSEPGPSGGPLSDLAGVGRPGAVSTSPAPSEEQTHV